MITRALILLVFLLVALSSQSVMALDDPPIVSPDPPTQEDPEGERGGKDPEKERGGGKNNTDFDPGLVGINLGKYTWCGTGCGGQTPVIKRANSKYYIRCPATTKNCTANDPACFCAAYWSPKGGNARNFYSKGIKKGGKLLIPSAQATNDWYSYCVK